MPLVSVVLSIYNGEKYLAQAIDSVLQQDLKGFELLLVDDGSSDGSLGIIRQYEKQDTRCRVLTGPNQGLIGSRNLGISQARAELVALMDQDDICMPNRLSKQLRYMNDHLECVVVGSKVLLIDPDGEPIAPMLLGETHEAIDAANMSGRGGAIVNPSSMLRKSAFLAVGMYPKDFVHAEDIDMFLRLAEVGRVANIPDILLHYRQHLAGTGYQHRQKQQASAIAAVQAACQRRGLVFNAHELAITATNEVVVIGDVYAKWAWWALDAGYVRTMRKYAFRAWLTAPYKTTYIKLMLCALRGH
ncbi:glycosyltransferase [Curvibacter sp. CHRR-16]|uniref:glycosyltransferase family 2 protein n=1 Tax=Curvibacter sp. CHRR-16 TaxID=2835872 RepID=UPI001BDA7200|nr:glycosyltransferase [Curvibacter sp. CHRR-16]MBT0571528.1 glycosyltransferase [Curvibacter sp. CHRR-16]